MKNIITSIISVILCLYSNFVFSAQSTDSKEPMKCEIGPIKKIIGGNEWLAYSCSDNKSLVFLATEKNSASPFYFMLFPKDGEYQIIGEGTGNKVATAAAYKQLSKMNQKEIFTLIQATKSK